MSIAFYIKKGLTPICTDVSFNNLAKFLDAWNMAAYTHLVFFFLIQRIQPELKPMKMCTFKPKVPVKGTFSCEQTDTNVKRSAWFHMPFFLYRSYLDRRLILNGSQNVWIFFKDLELKWVSFWGFSFLLLHIRAVVFVLCGNFKKISPYIHLMLLLYQSSGIVYSIIFSTELRARVGRPQTS